MNVKKIRMLFYLSTLPVIVTVVSSAVQLYWPKNPEVITAALGVVAALSYLVGYIPLRIQQRRDQRLGAVLDVERECLWQLKTLVDKGQAVPPELISRINKRAIQADMYYQHRHNKPRVVPLSANVSAS